MRDREARRGRGPGPVAAVPAGQRDPQGVGAGGQDPGRCGPVEINEAFAAIALPSMRDLDITDENVNVNGGAISMGHPVDASGARVALHLPSSSVTGPGRPATGVASPTRARPIPRTTNTRRRPHGAPTTRASMVTRRARAGIQAAHPAETGVSRAARDAHRAGKHPASPKSSPAAGTGLIEVPEGPP
jgi:hypothetical protein